MATTHSFTQHTCMGEHAHTHTLSGPDQLSHSPPPVSIQTTGAGGYKSLGRMKTRTEGTHVVYVTHIHTHSHMPLLALAVHHYTESSHAWCPTTGAYAVKTHLHRHKTDITKTVTPSFTSFLLKHRALLITTTPRMVGIKNRFISPTDCSCTP